MQGVSGFGGSVTSGLCHSKKSVQHGSVTVISGLHRLKHRVLRMGDWSVIQVYRNSLLFYPWSGLLVHELKQDHCVKGIDEVIIV